MTKDFDPYSLSATKKRKAIDPAKLALMNERNKKLAECIRLYGEVCDLNLDLGFFSGWIEDADQQLLWRCEFSVRAYNCLYNEGFRFLMEVDIATDEELLSIPNLGKTTLREIRETVAFHLTERFPDYKQRKGEKT
jgi:hypothetical protein